MSERPREMGDAAGTAKKLDAKYDSGTEEEVLGWFKELLGLTIESGKMNVEKALKNGVHLIELAMKIQKGSPNAPDAAKAMKLKPNTQTMPFKQMENIENFVKFCEAYGVPRGNTFQTVDLYEGRNMTAVLNCVMSLGSEAQRSNFSGKTIGSKPTERHHVEFTDEQMKAGKNIIGLQAGSNKGASQSGMAFGAKRQIEKASANK